jgi:hypothetical protein
MIKSSAGGNWVTGIIDFFPMSGVFRGFQPGDNFMHTAMKALAWPCLSKKFHSW